MKREENYKGVLEKNRYHLIEVLIIIIFCVFAIIFSGNVILTDDEIGNIGFVKKEFGLSCPNIDIYSERILEYVTIYVFEGLCPLWYEKRQHEILDKYYDCIDYSKD